jgi:hypothetical protein
VCGSCKNLCFGGMYRLHHQGDTNRSLKEIVGSPKQFKIALRSYLVTHCFYDLVEYYQVNE